MIKGFTILEVLVSLTLCLTILGIVISNVDQSVKFTKRIINNQQVLESIFHTVDVIKDDLAKCGMRLQKAGQHFDLSIFEHTDSSFSLIYGRKQC